MIFMMGCGWEDGWDAEILDKVNLSPAEAEIGAELGNMKIVKISNITFFYLY